MFTLSVTVSCNFQACWQESVKYKTCLIFLLPFPTLVTDPDFIQLATGLLVNFQACHLIKQACLYHFQACPLT